MQHDWQHEDVGQLAVQLLQDVPQPILHDEPQLMRQGSKQLSERKPRRNDSRRQGRGQQLPTEGGGIAVQHEGAAHVGAQVVQAGAGVPHEAQPPLLRANTLKPAGLITERDGEVWAAASMGSVPSIPIANQSDLPKCICSPP